MYSISKRVTQQLIFTITSFHVQHKPSYYDAILNFLPSSSPIIIIIIIIILILTGQPPILALLTTRCNVFPVNPAVLIVLQTLLLDNPL